MNTRTYSKELRILHVEDDAVESMNLVRIFRKMGVNHQLHAASNGEEALQILRQEYPQRPDLILLDWQMPLMDGGEFLAVLRADEELCDLAVYVLTSSDLPQDKALAKQYNVASYSVKPFTPDQYNEVIRQLLAKWEDTDFNPGMVH
jgi:CheY-like chemotaxis protein